MVDIRQTTNYAKYLSSLGWTVENLPAGKVGVAGINYFIRKIPLLGAILKVQRPEEIKIDVINKLCRKYHVFQIIIEPKSDSQVSSLKAHGFKLSKSPYLPTKTLQIDLTKSREDIFKYLKKDARYAIRKSFGSDYCGERVIESNHGRLKESFDSSDSLRTDGGARVTIRQYSTPDEIKTFREGWKKSVKFSRYVPTAEQLIKLKKCFPQKSSLFLASHNISSRIIGGVIFTTSSHKRSNYITYYWQAFTNKEGRSTLSQYSLLWHGILWAKKNGYKVFDFEGIYDERFPNRSWLGFTHFKHAFGGHEVSYPGCYTKLTLFKRYGR